jgi:glycosyltransferase involved in cell wall biosynthesis
MANVEGGGSGCMTSFLLHEHASGMTGPDGKVAIGGGAEQPGGTGLAVWEAHHQLLQSNYFRWNLLAYGERRRGNITPNVGFDIFPVLIPPGMGYAELSNWFITDDGADSDRERLGKMMRGERAVFLPHHFASADAAIRLRNTGLTEPQRNNLVMITRMHQMHHGVMQEYNPGYRVPHKDQLALENRLVTESPFLLYSTNAERSLTAMHLDSNPGIGLSGEEFLGKSMVVPLGYDPNLFSPEITAAKRDENRRKFLGPLYENNPTVFGLVGRWHQERGTANTISAFIEAFQQAGNPNWVLFIAGGPARDKDGVSENEKIQSILDECPQNVRERIITGYQYADPENPMTGVPNFEVVPMLDVFINAAPIESFGLSRAEAQAGGVLVMYNDEPVGQEVMGGTDRAYGVRGMHEQSNLSSAICQVARMDSNHRSEIARNGQKWRQNFTWEGANDMFLRELHGRFGI